MVPSHVMADLGEFTDDVQGKSLVWICGNAIYVE